MSRERFGPVGLKQALTKDIVAFRPGRRGGYRIEAESYVVHAHAYGFGSPGYIHGSGTALKVPESMDSLANVEVKSRL